MRHLAVLLFLALANSADAAEPADAPASSRTPPAETTRTAPPDAGDEKGSTQPGTEASPDVFVPSEDISEDLSIAFPIDV